MFLLLKEPVLNAPKTKFKVTANLEDSSKPELIGELSSSGVLSKAHTDPKDKKNRKGKKRKLSRLMKPSNKKFGKAGSLAYPNLEINSSSALPII